MLNFCNDMFITFQMATYLKERDQAISSSMLTEHVIKDLLKDEFDDCDASASEDLQLSDVVPKLSTFAKQVVTSSSTCSESIATVHL